MPLLSWHSYKFTQKSYFDQAGSRLSVHLQSVVSPDMPCSPQEILFEAATQFSGSEFVLEYVNPGLRFGILRVPGDSRVLLQEFILRTVGESFEDLVANRV